MKMQLTWSWLLALGSPLLAQQESSAPPRAAAAQTAAAERWQQRLARLAVFERRDDPAAAPAWSAPQFVVIEPEGQDEPAVEAAARAGACDGGALFALVFAGSAVEVAFAVQDRGPGTPPADADQRSVAAAGTTPPVLQRRHAPGPDGRLRPTREFQDWPAPSGRRLVFDDLPASGAVKPAGAMPPVVLSWQVGVEEPTALELSLQVGPDEQADRLLRADYVLVAPDSAGHERALRAIREVAVLIEVPRPAKEASDESTPLERLARLRDATRPDDRDRKEAQQLFQMLCATCHGPNGRGDGPAAVALQPKPRNYTERTWQLVVSDDHLRRIIVRGGAAVGRSPMMPASPQLRDKPGVVDALVELIRGFGG